MPPLGNTKGVFSWRRLNSKGPRSRRGGDLPQSGAAAPEFSLTKGDLSDATLKDFQGTAVVLNIFPSVDTPVCAASVHKFNETAAGVPSAQVLCISRDLPFAQSRFCGAEGIEGVVMLSEMRDDGFGKAYGVRIAGGPLDGLFARAVVGGRCAGESRLCPACSRDCRRARLRRRPCGTQIVSLKNRPCG